MSRMSRAVDAMIVRLRRAVLATLTAIFLALRAVFATLRPVSLALRAVFLTLGAVFLAGRLAGLAGERRRGGAKGESRDRRGKNQFFHGASPQLDPAPSGVCLVNNGGRRDSFRGAGSFVSWGTITP